MASYDGTITLKTLVDTKGIKTGASQIKSGLSGIGPMLSKIGAAVGIAFGVAALVNFAKESSKLAIQLEANSQRIIDIYGSASNAVNNFIYQNSKALGLSKTTATAVAATYGNLLSVWADQETNAKLTNALLRETAVLASKTGRTTEDVAERIRSGLLGNTEAIEDLGVNVNIKTIEITDAFKRIADGRSWEQLDAYEQAQVRTLAILEQGANKYGTSVANNTAFIMQQLKANWEDAKVTFGQAFSIIGALFVPAINTLIKGLTYVANLAKVAAVNIAALFGKKIDTTSSNVAGNTAEISSGLGSAADNAADTAGGVGDVGKAAKKANKEINKTVAAFDELQILASDAADSADGGSGGAGGGGGGIGGAGGVSEVGAIQDSGKSPNDYADETINALARIGKAVGGALMVIGVILLLTGNIGWGLGFIAAGAIMYGVSAMALLGDDPSGKALAKLEMLKSTIAPALLVLGVICIFLGAVPIGIGLIVAGATVWGVQEMKEQSSKDPSLTAIDKLNIVLQAVGTALIAVGVILLFLGQVPIGLGFIIMGATLFNVSSQQLNENGITTKVSKFLKDNQDLIVGISLAILIIGTVMMACGVITPISLGLLIAGAVGLASMAAINNTAVSTLISKWIKDNSGLIVGVSLALLVIGVVLCCCGVITPLSIGLIAAGAVGLAATVALNFSAIKEKVSTFIKDNQALFMGIGAALVVLGIICLFTVIGIPIGIGLIVTGAVALTSTAAVDWEGFKDKIKTFLSGATSIVSASLLVLGIICLFTGVGIPIGLGLILAGCKGIAKAEEWDSNGITRKIKDFVNGIITIFEKGVNYIIDKINSISLDIPDWVPGIGGGKFGFNISKISVPRLAKGAVLPPNKPFMAVVGDQTSGTNVEAPLDTIKQALLEVMMTSGSGNQPIVIEIDGREFGRAVLTQGNRESKRTSGKLVFA